MLAAWVMWCLLLVDTEINQTFWISDCKRSGVPPKYDLVNATSFFSLAMVMNNTTTLCLFLIVYHYKEMFAITPRHLVWNKCKLLALLFSQKLVALP